MKQPPSLPRLPIIGNLMDFSRDPLGFLERLKRDHGDTVGFHVMGNAVLVSHPDDVERVLLETGKTFHKGYQRGFATPRVLGNGLVTSEGDFWRRQRKLAQPAFHTKRIGGYAEAMVSAAREMLRGWQHAEERDAHRDMMHLTQRIVLETLFDFKEGGDADATSKALETVLIELERDMVSIEGMLPAFISTPSRARLVAALEKLDALVQGIIEDRRANPRANAAERHDLLSMLMDARDDDGQGMSDQQLRDEVMTLYIAGHETTSNTLSFTWLLLSQHPEVRERLEAELSSVLNGRSPSIDDLRALRYADAVIKESMRVYPAVWSISRVASVDTELGGYTIPKGTEVWVAQWLTQRDARWFDDPLRFRPERWLEGETPLEKRIPKYAYFPFGGGPRICIGNSFAQMEAVLLLCEIAQRFRLRVLEPDRVVLEPGATLRPKHGLRVTLEAREPITVQAG